MSEKRWQEVAVTPAPVFPHPGELELELVRTGAKQPLEVNSRKLIMVEKDKIRKIRNLNLQMG